MSERESINVIVRSVPDALVHSFDTRIFRISQNSVLLEQVSSELFLNEIRSQKVLRVIHLKVLLVLH